ncbi:hypothetical protein FA95DRAFT_1612614 [Auriscalpium vulgare]|uniref:Uncharacterized protein n=1 Tax=Auriscalpium vulgare TaxID=40419 RepID=A0ACB8R6I5_9AGAM|nr:hypothetical protein FA95DRAFT_1612614 [Auriscalpium vulgare]
MRACIRNADGTKISTDEWRAIKDFAHLSVVKLLELPEPADRQFHSKGKTRTRMYFRNGHLTEYLQELTQLEKRAPILSLCSGQWKADYLIGQLLTSDGKRNKKRGGSVTGSSSQPEKRRRGAVKESLGHDNGGNDSSQRRPTPPIPGLSEPVLQRGEAAQHCPEPATPHATQLSQLDDEFNSENEAQRRPEPATPARESESQTSVQHGSTASPSSPRQPLGASPTSALPMASSELSSVSLRSEVPSGPTAIDITYIKVNSTVDSLLGIMKTEFPSDDAIDLLQSMKLNMSFGAGQASENALLLLARIENADPNNPELSEEETDSCWGHQQFTAGTLSLRGALVSWDSIGSVAVACQFIAAAIKTCRVARHICFVRKKTPASFLSDAYLRETIERLWALWKDAGAPVFKGKKPEDIAAENDAGNPMKSDAGTAASETLNDGVTATAASLQTLKMPQLKSWMKTHNLVLPRGSKQRKEDLIAAILAAPLSAQPSPADVDVILGPSGGKPRSKRPPALEPGP